MSDLRERCPHGRTFRYCHECPPVLGPWEHEAAQPCVCGALVFPTDGLHEGTAEHFRALFEGYTPDQWNDLLAAVENGLGWADNEGTGMGDGREILTLLRLVIGDRLSG